MHNLIFALMLMAPQTPGQPMDPNAQYFQILPLVLIFIVFYFFMIRPQQKKQKEREQLLSDIKRGDRVVTIGGIHGTVAGIETEKKTVLVQVADNVKIKFERSAIANIEKQETGDKLATKE